ncbi:MAG TPA: hypothetical protein VFK05_19370 [Polyangiaceae bacterium]|nr:hypothetical protein [Polyangiaceae bacterium]
MAIGVVLLGGCASFSVLTPGTNATVRSPVAVDLYWNADLQPGSLKVVVDGTTDLTNQFTVWGSAADSHATASVTLTPGTHTLVVSGNLADSNGYSAQSASQTFVVSNTMGRPVTYTETILNFPNGWPAGSLGDVSFGGTSEHPNVNLIFTFEGNTNDLVPFHVPTSKPAVNDGVGVEIIAGTATVTVQDARSQAIIKQGTFIPQARVFVSVDNGNHGIGFGSLGALPTDSTFPNKGVEVAYPYALFSVPATDLASNYTASAVWALSCMGFSGSPGQKGPGTCNVPLSLGTTAGALTIISNDQQDTPPSGTVGATFMTVVH